MNLYALNETPINGWATHYGLGEAVAQLTLDGASANAVLGSGSADMALSSSGDGTRRTFGVSNPDLVLNAQGDGTRRTFGTADMPIVLTATAVGEVTASHGGTATLMLSWLLGRGGVMVYGSADASLRVTMDADGRAATGRYGTGDARMALEAVAHGKLPPVVKGGGLADMWIYPTGYPNMIAHAGGAADMQLGAAGGGIVGHQVFGSGEAVFAIEVLRSTTDQFRNVFGAGEIDIGFAIDTREARIVTLPSTFYPAHSSRIVRVIKESRVVRVRKSARTTKGA